MLRCKITVSYDIFGMINIAYQCRTRIYRATHKSKNMKEVICGGASMPIGHWHSSFKTGMPTISFCISVFESNNCGSHLKMVLDGFFGVQNAPKTIFSQGRALLEELTMLLSCYVRVTVRWSCSRNATIPP